MLTKVVACSTSLVARADMMTTIGVVATRDWHGSTIDVVASSSVAATELAATQVGNLCLR